MPSLAQRYGQGLLSGLEIQERQRRLRQADLLDEYRKEQIADIRWEREKEKKGLLAQIKAEEEQAKQKEMIGDIATVEAGGLRTGPQFMQSILAGEETPPETKERLTSIMDYVPGLTLGEQFKRTRVEEKVEGAPGAIPFLGQYLPEEIRPEAAEMAYGFKPKAGVETTRATLVKEDIERYMNIPEDQRTPFQQQSIDKYFRATGVSSLVDQVFGEIGVGEGEERPGELPPSLIDELGKFESFEDWYNGLSEDAQAELEAEPETLKAIRDWYAVPQ